MLEYRYYINNKPFYLKKLHNRNLQNLSFLVAF